MAATQDESIVMQLDAGVRGIKLSAVLAPKDPHIIRLCHTDCRILDAGPASATLDLIATWLQAHPDEVVTIMWNNLYNIDATLFAEMYKGAIMPFVYTHTPGDAWPTLRSMITSGKRLVNFVDAQANPEKVPWLMDQFSMVFETPYKNVDAGAFNCKVDRPASLTSTQGMMYVLNHFLYGQIRVADYEIDVPMRAQAASINGQSLRDHVANCTHVFGSRPNFIEVDFYEKGGDTLATIDQLNGLTLTTKALSTEEAAPDQSEPRPFKLKTLVIGDGWTLFSSGAHPSTAKARMRISTLLICSWTIMVLTG